jgi:hypothetical protein
MTTKHRPATRCRHASTYKAKRAPTCGCDVCRIKWQLSLIESCLEAQAIAIEVLVHAENRREKAEQAEMESYL